MLRRISVSNIIILGFFAVVLVGGLLLCLPISAANEPARAIDAFFTAVSATCITGLTTVTTGTFWSPFGKVVILLLIQIGGIGFMSLAMLFSVLLGKRLSQKSRAVFSSCMNLPEGEDLKKFFKTMMRYTFGIEAIGAVVMSIRLVPMFGVLEGLWQSVFMSVSAFCNAGFDILPAEYAGPCGSISYFVADPVICITIMLLITSGGLGFLVWRELAAAIKNKTRLSLFAKTVLIMSSVLILGGAAVTFACEYSNEATYGSLDIWGKLLASFFQSVTYRTAGYYSVDLTAMNGTSQVMAMLLMFIGGSPCSTAGGIKTTTAYVLVLSVLTNAAGKKNIVVGGRTIDDDTVKNALTVSGLAIMTVIAGTILLGISEGGRFGVLKSAYECVSACGTVGLTLGITPSLNPFSKAIVMLLMFFGRVGLSTVAYSALASDANKVRVKYPRTRFLVG